MQAGPDLTEPLLMILAAWPGLAGVLFFPLAFLGFA